jgi:hypothetical protein
MSDSNQTIADAARVATIANLRCESALALTLSGIADSFFSGCGVAWMTKRGLVVLACIVIAFVLGACALIDPVDSRYDTIGRSLAKARNEAIFLNLVRASHDYPLAFTTISQVTPSLTNTSTFGLPSFLAGPGAIIRAGTAAAPTSVSTFPTSVPGRDVVFGNTTASDSTAISTNFNVSTQETSAFYLGFLKPIDLQTLDYFIRQGYSRELLFWLFADSVQIKGGGATFGLRYDPPSDYGCDRRNGVDCFIDYIVMATAAGLTVEQRTVEKASGGGGKQGGDKSSGSAAKAETVSYARFCFDPVLGEKARAQMGNTWLEVKRRFVVSVMAFRPLCGGAWNPAAQANAAQVDTLNFQLGPYQFRIVPRSAYGVFEFLGKLIKMQRDHLVKVEAAFVPDSRPDVLDLPKLASIEDDPDIIRVVIGATPDCFSHTWFIDGDYCVPESAANTKRIFGLLAQLIAIETNATDLSITPIVRVIQ